MPFGPLADVLFAIAIVAIVIVVLGAIAFVVLDYIDAGSRPRPVPRAIARRRRP